VRSLKKTLGILAILTAAFLLSGCPSKPVQEQEPGAGAGAGAQERTGAETAGLGGAGGYTAADLNDPQSPLYQRVIYFDYDRTEILPQFVDILRAHASYLAGNPNVRLMLEGHTDERGTREYNLALGDQRADAVRRFLVAERASGSQIEILSYGEEKPADPGHYDSAWALNRRVELVY
jgi:peptidoglycan-associated lipoprotein